MDNQTGVVCPRDSAWLNKMLEFLPPGLRGKLAAYEKCQIVQSVARTRQHPRKNGRIVVKPVLR